MNFPNTGGIDSSITPGGSNNNGAEPLTPAAETLAPFTAETPQSVPAETGGTPSTAIPNPLPPNPLPVPAAVPPPAPLLRLASGIEAGIVGGIAMLALLVSQSLWDGDVWWEFPNLLGSTFYGPRAFRSGPGMASLAGVALHFVITGCLGGFFGLAFGGIRERGRLVVLGLAASVGWYGLANATFWPAVNPWVPAAAPRPGIVVSHVLLGACLGFMGQRHRFWPPAAPEHAAGLAPPPALTDREPSAFLSPAEMPLPNAQVAAAEERLSAHRGEAPAVDPSDALE